MPGTNALPASGAYRALYATTVKEAAAGGGALMAKLVVAARTALHDREAASRDLRVRDALAESVKFLNQREAELCKAYPAALLHAFNNPEIVKQAAKLSTADVQFDQLELMDEVQVQTSVTMARTQQVAMLAAEASLGELNTLICATLGLAVVKPERNPLRPEVYVAALKSVVEDSRVSAATQLDWLAAMSAALGLELRASYTALCANLRREGVAPAGYAVLQTPSSGAAGRAGAADVSADASWQTAAAPTPPGPQGAPRTTYAPVGAGAPAPRNGAPPPSAQPAAAPAGSVRVRGADDALLTLDKLRRLLAGDLELSAPQGGKDAFARRFAQEFESGPAADPGERATDFDATVPAALEALTEMKQVDRMVQSLQQRRQAPVPAGGDLSVDGVRQSLRRNVRDIAQALSLEVVTLMVENMARDARLLGPVQQIVRAMEPPLLRLALVDPRFFSDKQHPARQLLQAITHHSFAFDSMESTGFHEFLEQVQGAIKPLGNATIDGAAPFEQVLAGLQQSWQDAAQTQRRASQDVVLVLQHAEARNLLAEKIARDIDSHPDAKLVPDVVIDFLCGPWAQVVAQARIAGGSGSAQADKYQALISALLWSAHPEMARKSVAKLTRLVPRLITTLREGLDTIQYPSTRTSVFLEALMGIHQLAFRGQDAAAKDPAAADRLRAQFVQQGEPWIAPQEARASNFVDLALEISVVPQAVAGAADVTPAAAALPAPVDAVKAAAPVNVDERASAVDELPLGSWIELLVSGQWVRTQLTWASPHGTLFLFTSAFGTTQSMTRRSRDKLLAAGNLRLISDHPVVDSALDAVAQTALRNSLDQSGGNAA